MGILSISTLLGSEGAHISPSLPIGFVCRGFSPRTSGR